MVVATVARAGLFFSRSKVKMTSLALKGCPSDHLTPWRILKVRTVLSAFQLYSVASQGTSSPVALL